MVFLLYWFVIKLFWVVNVILLMINVVLFCGVYSGFVWFNLVLLNILKLIWYWFLLKEGILIMFFFLILSKFLMNR